MRFFSFGGEREKCFAGFNEEWALAILSQI